MDFQYPDGTLVHLCAASEWDAAREDGEVRPLPEVGFVHLSTPHQVHLPANRLFAGRTDILALLVDPAGLTGALRWEPGVPGDPESMVFPHLYGALPITAVVAARPYRPGPDGRFAAVPGIGSHGGQEPETRGP